MEVRQWDSDGFRLLAISFRLPPSGSLRSPHPECGGGGTTKVVEGREAAGGAIEAVGQPKADSSELIKEYTHNEGSCNRSDRAAGV